MPNNDKFTVVMKTEENGRREATEILTKTEIAPVLKMQDFEREAMVHMEAQYQKLKEVTKEKDEIITAFANYHSKYYGNYFDESPDEATKGKIKEVEKTVEALEKEKKNITHHLSQRNQELETLKERIHKIKLLVLPNKSEATLDEIEDEISKAVEIKGLNMTKEDLLEEIAGIKKTRDCLEINVKSLKRDQELIEFELRNAMAQATRLTGRKVIPPVYFAGSQPEKQEEVMNLLPISQSQKASGKQKPKSAGASVEKFAIESVAIPLSVVRQNTAITRASASASPVTAYCILCRKNVSSLESMPCEIHRNALIQGIWTCCCKKKEGKGCFVAKHCYLIQSADSKQVIITTDQEQKIKI